MLRALVVGVLVSLCGALTGVNLVLKRYSLIGDGLSHVGFGAMAVSASLGFAPLLLAIPTVIVVAFFLLGVKESSRIKGDSAIGLLTCGSLAVGVIVSTLSGGMNVELMNYMFGSILSVNKADSILTVVLCALVIVTYILFYRPVFAIAFDEDFGSATGMNVSLYRSVNAIMTAIVVVLGMRMMGTLLISGLLIFPPLSAMRIMKTYKGVVVVSAIISVLCFVTGIVVSYAAGTPVGATTVCINLIVFILCSAVKAVKFN